MQDIYSTIVQDIYQDYQELCKIIINIGVDNY